MTFYEEELRDEIEQLTREILALEEERLRLLSDLENL